MHPAYHHILQRRRKKEKSRGFDMKSLMDKLVYVSASFGVLANIPQLMEIWVNKRVEGVSIVTWLGFLLGSLFWFGYGILHKEKPIIIANALFVVVQFLIVLGLIVQHVPVIIF